MSDKSPVRTFGIIGYPLSHSYSPAVFNDKFKKEHLSNCEYKPFPLKNLSHFSELLRANPTLLGLNVTLPFKIAILPLLDTVSEVAQAVGAVNTIKIIPYLPVPDDPDPKYVLRKSVFSHRKSFILKGYNSDVFGFEQALKPLLMKHHRKALILGTGGAAKAVGYALKKLRLKFVYVTRKLTPYKLNHFKQIITFRELDEEFLNHFTLIVNSTPVGMHPHIHEAPPLPYSHLTPQHILFDLIYNPNETLFMKNGRKQGAIVKNGFQMLKFQAEKSWEIWNNGER